MHTEINKEREIFISYLNAWQRKRKETDTQVPMKTNTQTLKHIHIGR